MEIPEEKRRIIYFEETTLDDESPFEEIIDYLKYQLGVSVLTFDDPTEFAQSLVNVEGRGAIVACLGRSPGIIKLSTEIKRFSKENIRFSMPFVGLTCGASNVFLCWILNNLVDNYIDGSGDAAEAAIKLLDNCFISLIDSSHAINNSKIAVVDDVNFSRESLAMVLSIYKAEVRTFSSGEALLAEIHYPFDIFIVDIVLEKLSGIETIKQIKKHHPKAIILAISSVANPRVAVSALEAGAMDFVAKPVDMRGIVYRILSLSSFIQENKQN